MSESENVKMFWTQGGAKLTTKKHKQHRREVTSLELAGHGHVRKCGNVVEKKKRIFTRENEREKFRRGTGVVVFHENQQEIL